MPPSIASAPELPNETRRVDVARARSRASFSASATSLFVIEIRARHVDQARRLLLDRLHHARMAVAGRHHGDAGVEIEKAVAIHVLDDRAFALLRDQRIAARVGRRNDARVALDDRLARADPAPDRSSAAGPDGPIPR